MTDAEVLVLRTLDEIQKEKGSVPTARHIERRSGLTTEETQECLLVLADNGYLAYATFDGNRVIAAGYPTALGRSMLAG